MKVLSILNQQQQNRPLAFGVSVVDVLDRGTVLNNRGIKNVVAGECRRAESYVASLAFDLIGRDLSKNKAVLQKFPSNIAGKNVVQIGIKASDSGLNKPFILCVNHVEVFSNGKLCRAFVGSLEKIKSLVKRICVAPHLDRPILNSAEAKEMEAALSNGIDIKLETKDIETESRNVQRVANVFRIAIEKIESSVASKTKRKKAA